MEELLLEAATTADPENGAAEVRDWLDDEAAVAARHHARRREAIEEMAAEGLVEVA